MKKAISDKWGKSNFGSANFNLLANGKVITYFLERNDPSKLRLLEGLDLENLGVDDVLKLRKLGVFPFQVIKPKHYKSIQSFRSFDLICCSRSYTPRGSATFIENGWDKKNVRLMLMVK